MDRDLLRGLVRVKLNDHRLPRGRAVGFRETAGDGRPCDACDEPIDRKEKTVLVMVSLEWLSVSFHVDCYQVWSAERLARSRKDGGGHGGQL